MDIKKEDREEIIRSYKECANPKRQIGILTDLYPHVGRNGIKAILCEAGLIKTTRSEPSDEDKEKGKEIQRRREALDLTQGDLAGLSFTTVKNVSAIESGRSLTGKTYKRVLEALASVEDSERHLAESNKRIKEIDAKVKNKEVEIMDNSIQIAKGTEILSLPEGHPLRVAVEKYKKDLEDTREYHAKGLETVTKKIMELEAYLGEKGE